MWHPGNINLALDGTPCKKVKGREVVAAGSPHTIYCSSYPPVRKGLVQVVPHSVCIVGWCPNLLINDRDKDTIQLQLWLQEQLQHVQIVCPGNYPFGKHKRAINFILHETKAHIDFGRVPLPFGEFIWLSSAQIWQLCLLTMPQI